jgi:hypothetical protein
MGRYPEQEVSLANLGMVTVGTLVDLYLRDRRRSDVRRFTWEAVPMS